MRKRRLQIGLCLVILIAVTSVVWEVRPRERMLLDISRPAAGISDWMDESALLLSEAPYAWISDHELLHFAYWSDGLWDAVYVHDINTGRDRELKQFGKRFFECYGDPSSIHVSPGQRMAVFEGVNRDRAPRVYRASLDGASCDEHPHAIACQWLGNTNRWAAFQNSPRGEHEPEAVVRIAGSHSEEMRLHAQSAASISSIDRSDLQVGEQTIVSRISGGHPVFHTFPASLDALEASIELSVIKTNGTEHSAHRYSIKPPVRGFFQEWKLSPDGIRIAWLVISPPIHILPRWISRWLPSLEGRWSQTVSICVSGADGSNMHEIGHIRGDILIPTMVGAIQWLPNQSNLSFVYRDRLYTVPAD